MDDNTIELLKEIELLDSLSDKELKKISFAFVIKKLSKNELVLNEDCHKDTKKMAEQRENNYIVKKVHTSQLRVYEY